MQIGSEEGNIFMFQLDSKRISNSDNHLFTSSHVAIINRKHLAGGDQYTSGAGS